MTPGPSNADPISVAYVTCRYPPMTSSGTFRVQAMMRHFPLLGIEPMVVTIPESWVRQQTNELEGVVVDEPFVLRPHTRSDPLLQALSQVRGVRSALRSAVVPDILAPWARGAARTVSSSLRGVGLVYSTAPPFSSMILADHLADRLGVPLVQEVRDPPSFNRRLRSRSQLTRRRMRRFEGAYLSRADAVIAVTPGMRAGLLARHAQLDPTRLHVVTNGYPDIEADPSLSSRDPDRFTIAYVGSFQGSVPTRSDSSFTPEILIPALKQLPGNPQLRLVGPVTASQRAALGRSGDQLVEFIGRVPRKVAIAEIAAADVSLILAEDDPWWIGRKAFEYLAFAQRILAVVPAGDTSDLLADSPKSTVVLPADRRLVTESVVQLHGAWMSGVRPVGAEPAVQTDEACAQDVARILRQVALGE